MSECVEKVVHDKCGSKNLQVFLNEDGKYTGFCFGCGEYVHDPYHDKPKDYKPTFIRKTKEQIEAEIAEIGEYQTLDLPDRKLKKYALEYFGVKIGVSQEDGQTPVSHHYPYYDVNDTLVGYKNRVIENKKMWSIGDLKQATFFGWPQAKTSAGDTLYITEGECDAVALYQILKDANASTQYADRNPPIVSLPKGAGHAASALAEMLPEINKHFKKITLVFDMDEAGRKAANECLRIYPAAKVAPLPTKDVNDGLIMGRSKAVKDAILFKAETPKNTKLVFGSSLAEKARTPAEWGYSYPFKKLTEITRGQRLGEVVYWGAGVKMGKSELLNELVKHNIVEHGWPCFVAKTEETNVRTLQGVVGKVANKIFHDPKIEFDFKAFDEALPKVGDKLIMLDLYQELSWEILKGDIRAATMAGAKAVYIDPITTFTNGINAADANTLLQKICQELAQMAADLGFCANLFCHLKSPESGTPHERGGEVQSYQFAGSRAMMRSAHCMIGMEGNKDPDLKEEERNIRTLVVLENRHTGESGKVSLYYNKNTGSFNEIMI